MQHRPATNIDTEKNPNSQRFKGEKIEAGTLFYLPKYQNYEFSSVNPLCSILKVADF